MILLLSIATFAVFSIRDVLVPFFIALIFVYILRPIVKLLEERGLPRLPSLLLAYIGIILTFVLFSSYVGPILYNEGNGLMKGMPKYVDTVSAYTNDYIKQHPFLKGSQATDLFQSFWKSFAGYLEQIGKNIPVIVASVSSSVINFILGMIIAFYILKDTGTIRTTIHEMIPARYRAEGMDIVKKIDCIVGGFLKGQAMVALSVGILAAIGLSVLGLDYAILLGFIIGAFNIIPYLGPILGGVPAVIIALGTSWQLAIVTIVVLLVIQQFDSIFISPRIMSSQVNLHPVVVIFAILAGEQFLGIIGMLIAIPLAAVGKALYLHFKERHEKELGQHGGRDLKQPAKV
jgi:predicted PurR-regulated permease PerM